MLRIVVAQGAREHNRGRLGVLLLQDFAEREVIKELDILSVYLRGHLLSLSTSLLLLRKGGESGHCTLLVQQTSLLLAWILSHRGVLALNLPFVAV